MFTYKDREDLERLISRSEERVDRINQMVCNLISMEKDHAAVMQGTADMFRTAVETYAREVSEMRNFRNMQEQRMHGLQEELKEAQHEIDRLLSINADMLHSHQLLIANLTKLNINVRS